MRVSINDLRKRNMEHYYTDYYFHAIFKKHPIFFETNIHPDCLVKMDNKIYAVEDTGYFYQQETDFSNRIYKKVNKLINDEHFFKCVYERIGRNKLVNVIDAIYYRSLDSIFDDLILDEDIINEIKINQDIFYNDHLNNNCVINGKKYQLYLKDFLNKINPKLDYYRMEITLDKKYSVPIKVIVIFDKLVRYNRRRTLVPIVSFKDNKEYNFISLRSLVINKENKLKNIYIDSLKNKKVKYNYFILLIHPLDAFLDINPKSIYNKLKDLFQVTNYYEIGVILKDHVMVINREGYKLY